MNRWRSRLLMWLLITGVMLVHGIATESLPNTPVAMLAFHGSAALLDALLLWLAPAILSGRLCDHTQFLLMASVAGNFGGWLLYMAYAPPGLYNVVTLALTAAQWIRLLIPDGHDADHSWLAVVRDRAR